MNYIKIDDCDTLNVENGVAVSLWVAGCPHRCKGCFNPETWSYDAGNRFEMEDFFFFLDKIITKYVNAVSFLGGEPLAPYNIETVEYLAKNAKLFDKQTYVWTGYEIEELFDMYGEERFDAFDVIICGRFVEELKNPSLKLRGSSNQRIMRKIDGEWINELA